jgi:hypothetical protein
MITAALGAAVFGSAVASVARVRSGNLGARGRISQEIAEAAARDERALIRVGRLTAFDWDAVFVFGPYTPDKVLRGRANLPATVAWVVNLDARDDLCLLVFVRDGVYRGHIAFPRDKGDFVPAVREDPYPRADAEFFLETAHGPRLVPAAAG